HSAAPRCIAPPASLSPCRASGSISARMQGRTAARRRLRGWQTSSRESRVNRLAVASIASAPAGGLRAAAHPQATCGDRELRHERASRSQPCCFLRADLPPDLDLLLRRCTLVRVLGGLRDWAV